LHQRTKFRKDRSNRCGDIAIFVIFKMAAAAILDFQKFEILTVDPPICVTVPNLIKIGQMVAERWRFNVFQNGGRPPSWICWAPIGTTHDDILMVSIVVQNLVEIDAVVSIT